MNTKKIMCILAIIAQVCSSINVCAQDKSADTEDISSFEKALEELYAKKPYLRNLLKNKDEEKENQKESWPDYETCKKSIDWIAMTSAAMRIYIRHKQILQGEQIDEDMVDKALKYAPDFVQRICKQSRFFKDSVDIVLETLLFKTVARMILYCLKGDGFDLIKQALQKGKKIVIG